MEPLIRNAHFSDIPYLYRICLETGDNGKDASTLFDDPFILGQYYAAPYLFYDISLCFIVETQSIPTGYIIATDDTTSFNSWLENTWLIPLRTRYALSEADSTQRKESERSMIRMLYKTPETLNDAILLNKFPAHLHIDLLPEIQGLGYGRKLIEVLCYELRKRNCPGVHLGVSAKNTDAIRFYQKMGFTVLEEDLYGKTLGYCL